MLHKKLLIISILSGFFGREFLAICWLSNGYIILWRAIGIKKFIKNIFHYQQTLLFAVGGNFCTFAANKFVAR
jgi:hypothetical protein